MRKIYTFTILMFFMASLFSFAQTARVQVIHNSADLAVQTVDIYLNDVILLPDFEFRTASEFINATAGVPVSIEVAAGDSTSSADAIYEITQTFTTDETYILVADGNVSDEGYTETENFSIEVYEGGREVANIEGTTNLLIHHGVTDAPPVAINEVEQSAPLVSNLSYTQFSPYLELPTNDYIINVTTDNGANVIGEYSAPLSTIGLDDLAVTVLASGFLDPSMNSDGAKFGLWVALPSGGDLIELETTLLSVDNFKLTDINLYPNPAENILNIDFKDVAETKVNLYDMSGRLVMNTVLINTNNKLDMSQLKSGIYVVELSNENGKARTKITIK